MLAARHAEVEVVEHQHRQADVASRGVQQVRAADPRAAIPHDDDHLQVGVGQLDAGGVGDAAAVQPVERMGGEILVAQSLAADVGHDHHAPGVKP